MMYRGGGTGKPMAEEKGYNKAKGKAKRKIPFAPVTALEYFIYVCTFLFVAVFTIMQGVFLYKLHLYEASMEESHNPGGGGRIPAQAPPGAAQRSPAAEALQPWPVPWL